MARNISFTVVNDRPFTVKYRDTFTGKTKNVEYPENLTDAEMLEKSKTVFDEPEVAPVKSFNVGVRSLKEGTGITGVRLNLSLAHCQHMSWLTAEAKHVIEKEDKEVALQLLRDMANIMEFIVRDDFPHPMDPRLWEK